MPLAVAGPRPSPMLAVALLPRRPSAPRPKHRARPLSSTTHVWSPPAEMDTAVRPVGSFTMPLAVGAVPPPAPMLAPASLPSWPYNPRPKHRARPSFSSAHVCSRPAEMDTAVVLAGSFTMPPAVPGDASSPMLSLASLPN